MTNEVYFMVPSGTGPEPKYEPYLMVPSTGVEPEVYLMNPTGQPLPPGGPEGGGETVWTVWGAALDFQSAWTNGSFTTTPGDYTGGGYIMTVPGGYTKAKLVGIDGYWTYTAGTLFCGSLWVKTLVEAKLGGTGTLYGAPGGYPDAVAEWKTVSVEIALGTDRKIHVGYHNDTPVAGPYMQFRIFLAP
jgi:hypothetical protein